MMMAIEQIADHKPTLKLEKTTAYTYVFVCEQCSRVIYTDKHKFRASMLSR